MLILGIETSCDETAAALVKDGVHELAGSLATSKELHIKTGGIVPEVAARKQVESIAPVIEDCLLSGVKTLQLRSQKELISEIDYLAVTVGPGLIGSLVVGVEAAKALSLAWNKPVIPVNHLIGHIYANFIDASEKIEFPAVVLIVSGGHTDLVLMKGHGDFAYLGGTLDDAAGEAFDKTARLLGISRYLGGALLSKKAEEYKGISKQLLPRPLSGEENFDFSFSGLKTAVKRLVDAGKYSVEEISFEFQEAATDVLAEKTVRAAIKENVKSVLLGGGVSANKRLREKLQNLLDGSGIKLFVPPIKLCTDNAVYIASAAFFNLNPADIYDIKPNPSLGMMD